VAAIRRPRDIIRDKEIRMSRYVDAYVLPVPKKNIEDYRKLATEAGKVWKEHGALEYLEWIAEDVQPGKVTSFPQAVKLEPDETVVFSWIVYESRTHRDRVNAAAMNDPRLAGHNAKTMPFDAMRMFWGGFELFVEA
jgi:uncharacterized protein YbaA (DUF1428 family)